MYIPPSFAVTDPVQLHEFIEQHSFATLISSHEGEPVASHLPLLLDREAGSHGRLIGHMARANSHWPTCYLDVRPRVQTFASRSSERVVGIPTEGGDS